MDIDSPFYGRKCIATIHPNAILRKYDWLPLMLFDMQRAKEEAGSRELFLPERVCDLDLTADQICEKLDNWTPWKLAALDIEGGVNLEEFRGITCMSIAEDANYAFVIDWTRLNDRDKVKVFDSYSVWMRRHDIPKVMHGGLYDVFCVKWKHKVPTGGFVHDTMLSAWELYCELAKSLANHTSIFTREPYYKDERKALDWHTHLKYCCKDSMVTYEIHKAHMKELSETPASMEHYTFNTKQLPMLSYIMRRGFKYDTELAKAKRLELQVEQDELMATIEILNGEPINPNSSKQMCHALYSRHRFEPQYQKERGRKTNKQTADGLALLTLFKKYDSDFVFNLLKWKQLDGVRKQLDIKLDDDGRIRSHYNPVGTETGRYACYKSNTGSGYNLQTTTKRLRETFIADDDHLMAQIDLSGADGWTVAAHSLRLGDDTLMNDYLTGVKPAKVIGAMYLTGDTSIANMSSEQVLSLCSEFDWNNEHAWLYAASKAGQHGSCYGMGKITMSSNILRQSWKKSGTPIYVEAKECERIKNLFFRRYKGIEKWQHWVKRQVEEEGCLTAASGHTRQFFGRRTDNATYQTALSHEPQANTTYATALAGQALWSDPRNRTQQGDLIIEPLHQVHDALVVQFHKDTLEDSKAKINKYFDTTLTIGGVEVKIPFEAEIGHYWGDDSVATL
jgi:DNA polymerase I-like protein with 3'-5' exonuclease and polymerase domains